MLDINTTNIFNLHNALAIEARLLSYFIFSLNYILHYAMLCLTVWTMFLATLALYEISKRRLYQYIHWGKR